jgi:hypothetical protein
VTVPEERFPVQDDVESAKQTADKNDYAAIELDYNEPILHVAYMLPYRLEKSTARPTEFIAHQCYHNPTFLYGNLDFLGQ